jgi:hypothetical protein
MKGRRMMLMQMGALKRGVCTSKESHHEKSYEGVHSVIFQHPVAL